MRIGFDESVYVPLSGTIPYRTIPYHTIPYHTIPYHTIPYPTLTNHTVLYHGQMQAKETLSSDEFVNSFCGHRV